MPTKELLAILARKAVAAEQDLEEDILIGPRPSKEHMRQKRELKTYECRMANDTWNGAEVVTAYCMPYAAQRYAEQDPEYFEDPDDSIMVRLKGSEKWKVFHARREVDVTWEVNDVTSDYDEDGNQL